MQSLTISAILISTPSRVAARVRKIASVVAASCSHASPSWCLASSKPRRAASASHRACWVVICYRAIDLGMGEGANAIRIPRGKDQHLRDTYRSHHMAF
jgi:hypothetical protein